MGSLIALLPALGKIIEKVIPDPNKALELKAEIMTSMMNAESELYKAQGSIITAEAQGESWLQRNWRPLTMLTFVFIIANNYILVPWLGFLAGLFGYHAGIPVLDIPEGMWGLLQIGIGGYIASRGVEKTVESVQKGGIPLIGNKNAITKDDLAADRAKLLEEMRNVR